MAETDRTNNGVERAAILLMALGEQSAAAILKHMNPKEVQRVGAAMATLRNVSTSQVQVVMSDFITTVESQTALGVGSEDYIRSVMVSALGDWKRLNGWTRGRLPKLSVWNIRKLSPSSYPIWTAISRQRC